MGHNIRIIAANKSLGTPLVMGLSLDEIRVWMRKGEGLGSFGNRWAGSLSIKRQIDSVQSLQDLLQFLLLLPFLCTLEQFLCRNLLPHRLAHLL